MCDPNWHLSRVGLITSGFACSILVLILAVIIPFLLAAHWLHGKYCLIVFMQSHCTLVGGVTCRVTCTWWLAVKGPGLGLSRPPLTPTTWTGLENILSPYKGFALGKEGCLGSERVYDNR